MLETAVRDYLRLLLKRRDRKRSLNRLVSFGLFSLGAYFLLLSALLLFGFSLVLFHLLFFAAFSLFPLFFLFEAEVDPLRESVRRIDEDCLLESYLAAGSQEHRSFMISSVRRLLERRAARGEYPFRFSRANAVLAAAAFSLLLLTQALSLITLQSFSPGLSARQFKARLAEREAAREAAGVREGRPPALGFPGQERPEAAGPKASSRSGESRAEAEMRKGLAEEASEPPRIFAGEAPQPGAEAGREWERVLVPLPEAKKDLKALLEAAVRGRADEAGMPGSSEAGSGDSGLGFLESPLKRYLSRPEGIGAGGGRELAPGGEQTEALREQVLGALFSDFQLQAEAPLDFDPLIERIKERYLELLNEKP